MTETWTSADQSPSGDANAESGEPDPLRNVLRVFVAILALAALALVVLLVVVAGRDAPSADKGSKVGRAAGYPIELVKAIYGTKANDAFNSPLGVAFDADGNVWISDTGNRRVAIMTAKGSTLGVIGTGKGPGSLMTPNGIASDPARERMYVADWTQGALLAYSTSGRFLERFPAADQDKDVFGTNGFTPFDVKLAGSRIVAASNDGLYFFDRTGHVVERWGSRARVSRPGAFNFPNALAVDDKSKLIYVADTLNRRVVALDFDGHVRWISGSPDTAGKITGFWQLPRGMVVGPDGALLVVDTFRFDDKGVGTGHIVALSKDGKLVSEFGRAGDEEDSFDFPEKIAAGPDGLFAIADREHARVVVFRLGPLPSPDVMESRLYSKAIRRPEGLDVRHEVTAASTTTTSGG